MSFINPIFGMFLVNPNWNHLLRLPDLQYFFFFLQEENFTRATEFIPQRWIPEERPKDWVHKAHLVVPFGSGKRICPGKRLAEQEIHIIIGKIFRNFHLTPKDDLEIEFNWLMSPSGPLRFSLEKVSADVEN